MAVVGRVEVDVLPLDRAPEARDEGIVGGAAPAVVVDAVAGDEQGLLINEAGKLAVLVGIEDIWGLGRGPRRVAELLTRPQYFFSRVFSVFSQLMAV